jgi:hypothetical protein
MLTQSFDFTPGSINTNHQALKVKEKGRNVSIFKLVCRKIQNGPQPAPIHPSSKKQRRNFITFRWGCKEPFSFFWQCSSLLQCDFEEETYIKWDMLDPRRKMYDMACCTRTNQKNTSYTLYFVCEWIAQLFSVVRGLSGCHPILRGQQSVCKWCFVKWRTWVQCSSRISDIVTDIIHCLYDYREVSLKFYSFMQVRGNCKVIYWIIERRRSILKLTGLKRSFVNKINVWNSRWKESK